MGDTTNLTVTVKGVHPADRQAVEDIITGGGGNDFGGGWLTADDAQRGLGAEGDGNFGMWDRYAGTVEDAFSNLHAFMTGDPDDESRGYHDGEGEDGSPRGREPYQFAIRAHQDPLTDGTPGWLFASVPGVGEITQVDCDGEGTAYLSANQIKAALATASTLSDARRELDALTGMRVLDAFEVYPEVADDTEPARPLVEVIGYRDPDGDTDLVVFVDGVKVEASIVVLDPGASLGDNPRRVDEHAADEWRAEQLADLDGLSPAAADAVRDYIASENPQ